MSTKIYNGRRIALGFAQACEAVNTPELREQLTVRCREVRAFELARMMLVLSTQQILRDHGVDSLRVAQAQEPVSHMPIMHALNEIGQKQFLDARAYHRRKSLDFENLLMLKQDPCNTRQTLVGVFFSNPRMLEVLESTGLLSDYHYQDNTDAPDAVDAQEWAARKRAWKLALPGSWVASGFVSVAYGDPSPVTYMDFWTLPQSEKDRIWQQALDFNAAFVSELLTDHLFWLYTQNNTSTDRPMAQITRFRAQNASEEGRAQRDELFKQWSQWLVFAPALTMMEHEVDLDLVQAQY